MFTSNGSFMLNCLTAGTMEGSALIEILHSMSQAGYSASMAPGQQQLSQAALDAVPLPAPQIAREPASIAPAEPEESAAGMRAPAGAEPAQDVPAQDGPSLHQHADVPGAAQVEVCAKVEQLQWSTESSEPAPLKLQQGWLRQVSDPEKLAASMSLAPPQQSSEDVQPSQQQQAVDALSVQEAAAPQQVTSEMDQAPAERPEPPYGDAQAVGMAEHSDAPHGAQPTTEVAGTMQQAEEPALQKPDGPMAGAANKSINVQNLQDIIMHDLEDEPAQAIQAPVTLVAEPATPAAAGQLTEPKADPAVAPNLSLSEEKQAVAQQQAASAHNTAAEPEAEASGVHMLSSKEKVPAQDGRSLAQAQPGAAAELAASANEEPHLPKSSIINPCAEALREAATADHDHNSEGQTAKEDPLSSNVATGVTANSALSGFRGDRTPATVAAEETANTSNHAMQEQAVQSTRNESSGIAVPQEDAVKADSSSAAADAAGITETEATDGQM